MVEEVEPEAPADVPEVGENNDEMGDGPESGRNMKRRPNGCPFCDSSVYSYCSDKLLHDACCCLDPQGEHNKYLKIFKWVIVKNKKYNKAEKKLTKPQVQYNHYIG